MVVKTAFSLPEELFGRVEEAAKEQGLSRSAFVLAALKKYLFDLETERLIAQWTAAVAVLKPEQVREDLEWADWYQEELEALNEREGDAWQSPD
jgi:metal-responsive CopG/Arc/MetJ family transcriptional regulator